MIIQELRRELLNDEDPFDYAQRRNLDHGYPHTFLPRELVETLLETVQPTFWLEIGSMVGGSANLVAGLQSRTEVVCLDPFTADVGAWESRAADLKSKAWDCLKLEGGRPTIYERFLANVRSYENHTRVLPLCMTSSVGTKLLRRLFDAKRISELPTVIYLDSAHEPGETLLEIQNAWALLPEGGILFGDDWDWPAVKEDVAKFLYANPYAKLGGLDEIQINLQSKGLGPCETHLYKNRQMLLYKNQWILCK